jgi:hypothetical protein
MVGTCRREEYKRSELTNPLDNVKKGGQMEEPMEITYKSLE